ncbi:hypothetical protein ACWFR1_34085 [Streptomyces sp. NPDC055103]
MRVRMRIKISGTRDGEDWPDKDGEITLPDDEAEQLLRYGAAETVTEPDTTGAGHGEQEPDEETAAAPDTAEARPRSRRKA